MSSILWGMSWFYKMAAFSLFFVLQHGCKDIPWKRSAVGWEKACSKSPRKYWRNPRHNYEKYGCMTFVLLLDAKNYVRIFYFIKLSCTSNSYVFMTRIIIEKRCICENFLLQVNQMQSLHNLGYHHMKEVWSAQ